MTRQLSLQQNNEPDFNVKLKKILRMNLLMSSLPSSRNLYSFSIKLFFHYLIFCLFS